MSESLNEKQRRFVSEYLGDPERNAARAAQRAGYSPRSAGSLMAHEGIREAIKQHQEAAASNNGVSLETLIAEAEAAREVAEHAGNGSAMIAAIRLKAELSDKLDAIASPKLEAKPSTVAETARAIFDIMREASLRTSAEAQSAAPVKSIL